MARCKDYIHNKVCRYRDKLAKIDEYTWYAFNKLDNVQDFCRHFIADVVPKSEVESLKHDIERIIDEGEYWQGKFLVAQSRVEKIFEEIGKLIIYRMIDDTTLIDDRLITDIAELKKNYVESENNNL